jgi:hypothetical protein
MEGTHEMTAQEAIEDFYNMVLDAIANGPDYAEKRKALEAAGVQLEQIEVHLYISRVEAKARADEEFLREMRIAPDLTVSDQQERS